MGTEKRTITVTIPDHRVYSYLTDSMFPGVRKIAEGYAIDSNQYPALEVSVTAHVRHYPEIPETRETPNDGGTVVETWTADPIDAKLLESIAKPREWSPELTVAEKRVLFGLLEECAAYYLEVYEDDWQADI